MGKNKIVSDKRKAEILDDCKRNKNNFICHKASMVGKQATCKGFYDKCTNSSISKLLESTGHIKFVDIK